MEVGLKSMLLGENRKNVECLGIHLKARNTEWLFARSYESATGILVGLRGGLRIVANEGRIKLHARSDQVG
jgi:hypothetical protein